MIYYPNFKPVPFHLGLYPIINSTLWIKRLIKEGVHTLQLRIKEKKENEIESDISTAIALCNYYNVRLFINDYWKIAIKYRAWGVHLGQEDLETADLKAIDKAGLRLGISTHNDEEINKALKIKPSYISLGHIFPTKTKKMLSSPQGIEKLAYQVKRLKNYPTVAIGGINLKNVSDVLETNVGGIALISAITQASNWKLATIQLLNLVGRNR